MIGIGCLNKSVLQGQISAAYYFLKGKNLLYKNSLNKKYEISDLTKYNLDFISCRDSVLEDCSCFSGEQLHKNLTIKSN